MKRFVIVPDVHVPFHCRDSVSLVTKIIKDLSASKDSNGTLSGLVQLGDALDAFQISSYSKDPSRRNLLVDDIDEWKKILNEWSRHLPRNSSIHLLEGNHEHRLSRYIANQCRDLHGLVPDWPTLLGLPIRNKVGVHRWFWHKYNKWDSCRIGDAVLSHGFYYNEHVALQCLKKYRTNIIFGHTHRFQYVSDGFNYAVSLGHISDEKETAHQPTPSGWKKAIGILHVENSGKTHFEPVLIDSRKVVVYGKVITL